MANLTYAQLEGVWIQAGGSQAMAPLMAAIAEAESSGNPNATNTIDNNGRQTSWGLWQISNGTHTAPDPNWNNPVVNAQLAVGKLNSQGLGAWGTYTSGAYKAFLSGSTTPDTSGVADAADTSAVTGAATAAAAQAEANCAWRINFNIPLIGGDVCVVSWSQLRAITAVAMLAAGGVIGIFGIASLINTSTGGAAGGLVGSTVGGAAELAGAGLAVAGMPEIGAPVAAAGAGAKRKGRTRRATAAAGRSAQRRRTASRAQDRRDESVARQVTSRKRDSAKGPALRDERPKARRLASPRVSESQSKEPVPF